jgi:hypothetical protein
LAPIPRPPARTTASRPTGPRSLRDHALPGRDYVKVVEHLAAAGADLGEDLIEVAEGPLADWLEDHLIGAP